ncbi:ATP-binding protein [Bacteroidota bacterium]
MSKKYKKTVPSDPDILPEVEEFVMDIAERSNLNKSKFNNLALSVAEAASNSIIHGNKLDINKKVHIEIRVDDSTFQVSFRDEGKGFRLSNVPDPTKPENILKDSGRGIHIMKSFLDDIKFNFTHEGTEVILILNLDNKDDS